jgi:hypothetical protein
LIIYGKCSPLVAEDSVKVFDVLSGLNVFNIQPFGDKLLISTEGTYEY